MNVKQVWSANLPHLGATESSVLRHLVALDLEYQRRRAESKSGVYVTPPTTRQLATHFNMSQRKVLRVLNHLELLGLVTKHRRLSAGPSGYGYDGSLHSEVHPTERALRLVARHPP